LERLYELPISKSVISAKKDCLMRFEQIYSELPHKLHLGLIETVDTYNMNTYPDTYNDPNQEVYDIDAMDRYTVQMDNNLDEDIEAFDQAKDLHGDNLMEIYDEIERLKLLPVNSVTNKALYEMYLKLIDMLNNYPIIDPVELIHQSPFIKAKPNSELLSIENIPEL
jgi:hypothetical protein